MAVSAATATSDFSGFITRDMAAPIFEAAARVSAVQAMARQVPLAGNGVSIPYTSAKPTAGWVSEGGAKPATNGALGLKTMDPKKLAAILVVSSEVVRANPGNYINTMRADLAEAFATAFDKAALYDQGPDGSAGAGPFSTNLASTSKNVEIGTTAQGSGGIHGDLVAALGLMVADGKRLNGWVLDDQLEPTLLGATDTSGRPLYVDLPTDTTGLNLNADAVARRGSLLGRTAYMTSGIDSGTSANVLGFGGDWSKAVWGVVGGISYTVSTEATVTVNGALVSLFENNLVAIRAEAEYGFLVHDTAAFVKLADAS
jgi:HK97 family phage major capsid protein